MARPTDAPPRPGPRGVAPTLDEIREWPATVPLAQACHAFDIGRSFGYELAKRGQFPARVIEMGSGSRKRRVCVTASIIAALEGDGAAQPRGAA